MLPRCRFAAPLPLMRFQVIARAGHDSHVCTVGRVPRFPRNVRRLASSAPRTCGALRSRDWWVLQCEGSDGWPLRTPLGAKCRDFDTVKGFRWAFWPCWTHAADRAWQAEADRYAAQACAFRFGA